MVREFLELLFAAAALLIDTLRTFFLIVLSILGLIAFAISVWDGFQSTLTQWFTRHISIYLWLPAADLFSSMLAKIQELILKHNITQLQNDPTYTIDASNGMYLVFMIIGIIGYFTIPIVAGWVIQVGGAGNFGKNVNYAAAKGAGVISRGLLPGLQEVLQVDTENKYCTVPDKKPKMWQDSAACADAYPLI